MHLIPFNNIEARRQAPFKSLNEKPRFKIRLKTSEFYDYLEDEGLLEDEEMDLNPSTYTSFENPANSSTVEDINPSLEELEKSSIYVEIYMDTEYQINHKYPYISVQAYLKVFQKSTLLKEFKVVIIDKDLESTLDPLLLKLFESENKALVFFKELNINSISPLTEVLHSLLLQHNFIEPGNVNNVTAKLFYFYQVMDLSIAFGYSYLEPYYLKNKKGLSIFKKVRGYFEIRDFYFDNAVASYKIFVRDTSGLDNGGLKDFALSSGLDVTLKTSLDDEKARMRTAIVTKTSDFLKYALQDAVWLCEILDAKVSSYNDLMLKTLNLPEHCRFTKDTIPLTLGNIVNTIWEFYFDHIILSSREDYKLAFIKQGILDDLAKDYDINQVLFDRLLKLTTLEQLQQELSLPDKNQKNPSENQSLEDFHKSLSIRRLLKKTVMKHLPQEMASINALVTNLSNTRGILITMRTGGRSVNEMPEHYFVDFVIDLDIESAYGSQIRLAVYPIGRPRVHLPSSNETRLTLKEFLNKYYHKLEKFKLFKIVVTGSMGDFEQDLVLSKIVTERNIKNIPGKFNPQEPKTAVLATSSVLLRKEIFKGTITPSILNTIQKASSSLELAQFYSLKVDTALFWYDSDAVDSIEDLVHEFITDKGQLKFNFKKQAIIDERTFKWFPFKLESFIGPLVDLRTSVKKLKDASSKALSTSIKLYVNTLYGVITSVFFKLNNIVVSDIITSNIRVAVWQMAKAFIFRQSITDGSFCTPLEVFHFAENYSKKPGMSVLSKISYMELHPSLEKRPLGDIPNWKDFYLENKDPFTEFPPINQLALEHVKKFWDNYNLEFPHRIEAKVENTAIRAAYFMKSHYMLKHWNPKDKSYNLILKKVRGVSSLDLDKSNYVNPVYYLLLAILEGKEFFEFDYIYKSTSLLTLAQFQYNLKKVKSVYTTTSNIRPGELNPRTSQFRVNNTHCYLNYKTDYDQRMTRGNQKVTYTFLNQKESIPQFLYEWLFFVKPISEVIRILNQNTEFRSLQKERKLAQPLIEKHFREGTNPF